MSNVWADFPEASVSEKTRRVAIIVQYVGTHLHGWQRQPNGRTVQQEIEDVLESTLGYPVVVHGSGRTDAGVHAAAQVAHFEAPARIPSHRWPGIFNSHLPGDIVVRASTEVESSWHARFSAVYRRYRYTIYTDSMPNLFVKPFCWHFYRSRLNENAMLLALQPLIGRHHLSAFHRSGSSRPHSWVEMHEVSCCRDGPFIRIEMQASGFLYGMVRLLVGLLVDVGRGVLSVQEFTDIWREERRDLVRYAAPPEGLCLLRVGYEVFPFPPEIWYNCQPLLKL
ncbi:MAG: tRNA pseudouridine(38-40) synthase TruA [Leptolyngbyaceae bacterium]|nr:tRNA pseudouridine(38-40) synthase TruA [Leptolyngbyaceae bacterium]